MINYKLGETGVLHHRIIHLLNREQQTILKETTLKKCLSMDTPVHLFLTGGAGTGKTFTTKELFQMLI
jgi:Cdc6-like AAA superfamily ATPase